jgi:cell division protein FtsZ
MAISSQLLDITIDGARGILFNVTGGSALTLFEVNQAAAIIKETAHPDVNLIFGAVIDPNLGDEIRVTVIATGFDRANVRTTMPERSARVDDPRSNQQPARPQPTQTHMPEKQERPPSSPASNEFQARVLNTDDLDIPAFLRNRSHR